MWAPVLTASSYLHPGIDIDYTSIQNFGVAYSVISL